MTDVAVVDQVNPSNAGPPQIDTAALAAAVADQLKQPITFADVLAKSDTQSATPPVQTETPPVNEIAPVVFEKTGDVGLDMALEFIGGLGFDEKHPAVVSATKGDFAPLKALLSSNEKARGWENYMALAERSYQEGQQRQQATQKSLETAVYAEAGGEEKWKALQAFAGENASPEEAAALNKMLQDGPLQARAAVRAIQDAYNKKVGTVVKPASALAPGASKSDAPAVPDAPRNKRELVRAIEGLRRTHGENFASTAEYARLHAQFASQR